MKAADQSILQVLGPPKKLELTTKNIAHNAGVSRPYASERLAVLVDHGLIEKIEEEGSNPFYTITEKGSKVLTGEIDADELERDG